MNRHEFHCRGTERRYLELTLLIVDMGRVVTSREEITRESAALYREEFSVQRRERERER
jgi:hypothetical protein